MLTKHPSTTLRTGATMHVLVATSRAQVYEALEAIAPYQSTEAVTTRGVYRGLPNAQLAIVEFESLLEEEIPRAMLAEILNRSRIPWTTPDGFLQDPSSWRAHALAASGDLRSFPPTTAAITSYSGGVGKTTLALDTAVHFTARTRLPAAVIEFPHGPSALRALTGVSDEVGFVDVVDEEHAALPTWRGITLATANYHKVGSILKPEEIQQHFQRIREKHILTIVDSEFPHPWLDIVAAQIGTFIIVAGPRPDAWNNAMILGQEMAEAPETYAHSQVVFNMVDGWADRLTQIGLRRTMDLPRVKDPERFDGKLGGQLLSAIYPYWMSPPNFWGAKTVARRIP